MKQIIFFLLTLLSLQSFAQVIVDPKDFPSETNPNNSNFEFYSRKTNANRKASFDNVRKGMLPIVRQPADITYTPAPTGNSNDRGSIVRTATGRVYYIDGLGNSQQLNAPLGTLPIADNDIHAGVMCVSVGGWYRLSASNTLGLPAGDIRQRVYGSSTPCTLEGNSLSPGQTKVVGGAGILKVNGDPDTNPYVQRQDQYYEASVAWDTVARKIYTYNSSGTVGNRWDIFAGVSVDTRLDTAYIESDTLRLLVLDVNADTTLKTISVPLVFPVVLESGLGSPLPAVAVPGSTLIQTIDLNGNVALYFSDGTDWLGGFEIPGVKNLDSIMFAPGEIKAVHLGQSGADTGQVYKWNGTAWTPANDISLYNTNGTLTANRTIDLDDKYLQMVGSAGGGDLTSVYKFSPSEFSLIQDYDAGGSTDYYNSISYDLNGIRMQHRNADDESFYFNIQDDGFEVSSTQADFAGLRYALEYADILENDRSIPDVGLVNQLISDSLANVPSDALGNDFVNGGGIGSIPGETVAKLDPSGQFIIRNSDDNDVFITSSTGFRAANGNTNAVLLFDNDGMNISTGGNVLTMTPSGSTVYEDGASGIGIEYADDYSPTFTDRSLVDKAYVDAHGGSLGAGFTDGGGTGSVPDPTQVQYGLNSLRFANNEFSDLGDFIGQVADADNYYGSGFNNAGDGEYSTVGRYILGDNILQYRMRPYFVNFEIANTSTGDNAIYNLDANGLAITTSNGAGAFYTADYSATIAANDRSIPDVGTVNEMIADLIPGGGGANVRIDTFHTSGTWTKPDSAKMVYVICIGSGGGGGSGAQRAAGVTTRGGASGGSGSRSEKMFLASLLPATVSCKIAPGGPGGPGTTTDNFGGTSGSSVLNPTAFGQYLQAFNGKGANTDGVHTSTNVGGITSSGDIGVSSNASGLAGSQNNASNYSSVGGASGGGLTSANVASDGGASVIDSTSDVIYYFASASVPGGTVGAGQNGANGTNLHHLFISTGGAGGASNAAGAAGAGGKGGIYGGGGGGGGASRNGNQAGKGGDGGAGFIAVITIF